MSKKDSLQVDNQRLAEAWARTLPTVLNASDRAEVKADEAEANVIRIHIATAGRSNYSFDFKCTYVDSREVQVELIDVEREGTAVDERTDVIQTLVDDYVRHIHECAQQLHAFTHS
ncbi:hypothetical protein [Paenibacillus elgii]|uniref:Uncharacterized protein n=1 Tax=Paenibacillus elgii TaxID=189691 RepID=A0A163XJ06_9BACL|nr:hypothetical protein [Paenibacillus elgii]KZE77968.1 hypothetical protein AV654_20605 [Paenibacillus elgii]MCM3274233.1 hypothetical protein [Paenibacillus elgii]NEN84435.1 hypothetical protein [Paenibacillus elgii]PUA34577.1 hypothetical protein C8Z91_35705 [Paenibacillus elgii]